MHRFIVEGFSEESMELAMNDALSKVSSFMTKQNDINVSILEMATLPGKGFKVVLEVRVVPMGDGKSFKIDGVDEELKKIFEKEYQSHKDEIKERKRQFIAEYFSAKHGNFIPDIPESYILNYTDGDVLSGMIEKTFFRACHCVDLPDYNVADSLIKVLGEGAGLFLSQDRANSEPEPEPK